MLAGISHFATEFAIGATGAAGADAYEPLNVVSGTSAPSYP